MPFPFTLPTTSTVSFSQHYTSPTYPSLPLSCTTHRGILRDSLKAHKRLPLSAQGANIKHIINVTTEYISYLQFLQEALKSGDASPIPTTLEIETEWRPTLSSSTRFGITQSERRKGKGLEYEVFWVYSTLAYAHTIQARVLLMEFLSPTTSSPDSAASPLLPQATNHVLTSAQIFQYLLTLTPPIATAGDQKNSIPVNICEPMLSSLASISLGSATLLAVLRTDPYPTYLAITGIPGPKKNNDIYSKEYLYSPPLPPTGVKAMLYSRLCIAASEHAVRAQGVISDLIRAGVINEEYVRYLEDLKRVAKARGCRFLGVDAEVQGRLGEGLGWIKLGKEFLGGTIPTTSSNDDKEKKTLASRMEKLRLSNVHSELQTIEGLDAKWSKTNDKLVFEKVPATNSLVSKIPGGREIHDIKAYSPVKLGSESINTLRRGGMEGSSEYSQHQDWPTGDYPDSSDEEDGGKGSSYQVPGGYY
ncbi:hypothetical protein BGX38DRAFT_1092150 [Terfezia claveryi]|nr:hypothetical protein BGX38DRAFT_1092150 [Terfezia claveryi]